MKPGTTGFHQKPINFNPPMLKIVKADVDRLLKAGVIMKQNDLEVGSMTSRILVVPRPDSPTGEKRWRTVLDLRACNKNINQFVEFMPTIPELLDKISNQKPEVFCSLDFREFYYHLKLTRRSVKYTGFQVQGDRYVFKRAPMGLSISSSYGAALSRRIFEGELNDFTAVYMDDVIVTSKTIPQMLERIEKIFKRVIKYNIKFSPMKCSFFEKETSFLGHKIDRNGIGPDPKRVKRLKEYQIPDTVKAVKRFLACSQYWKRYCKGYSETALPLYAIVKNNDFKWTSVEQYAFDTIRNQIVTATMQAHPDWSLPWAIQTDSSGYATGAVLIQYMPDGTRVPLGFTGRVFSKAEVKMSSVKREGLGILHGLSTWKNMIRGKRVKLQSDCLPLLALVRKSSHHALSAPYTRMLIEISNYDLDFEFLRGKDNSTADALSRVITESDKRDMPTMKEIKQAKQTILAIQAEKRQTISKQKESENKNPPIAAVNEKTAPKIIKIEDYMKYAPNIKSEVTDLEKPNKIKPIITVNGNRKFQKARAENIELKVNLVKNTPKSIMKTNNNMENSPKPILKNRDHNRIRFNKETEVQPFFKWNPPQDATELDCTQDRLTGHSSHSHHRSNRHEHSHRKTDRSKRSDRQTSDSQTKLDKQNDKENDCMPRAFPISDKDKHRIEDRSQRKMAREISLTDMTQDEIMQRQSEDPEILELQLYFAENELPANNKKASRLIGTSENFIMSKGLIYKLSMALSGDRIQTCKALLYVPDSMKAKIIQKYHESYAHIGTERLVALLQNDFFWKNMHGDCRQYVKHCKRCQEVKSPNDQKHRGPVKHHQICLYPMNEVMIDTVHMPLARNGARFLISAIDSYSRFSWAFSVKTKSNEEVIPLLYDNIWLKYGAPKYVVSDNGGDMTSKAFKDMYKKMGTKQILTSYYTSRSNGAERLNKEIIRTLKAQTGEDTGNWPNILPEIMYVLNNSPKSSLGNHTPAEMFFGWKPKNPLFPTNKKLEMQDMPKTAKQMLEKIYDNHVKAQKIVYKYTKKAYPKIEKEIESKLKLAKFEVGDFVMLYNSHAPVADKISTAHKKYVGPYEVVQATDNNVRLKIPASGQILNKTTNIRRVRHYHDMEDLSKLQPPIEMEAIPLENVITDKENPPYVLEPIITENEKRTENEIKTTNEQTGKLVYKEVIGDLFSSPDDECLAHCVSADLVMGSGIAIYFRERFKGLQTLANQQQDKGGLAILKRNNRYIYYLVTKERSWQIPKYRDLESSLIAMKEHCIKNKVKAISMPQIATGLDKLEWYKVKQMIQEIFKDVEIKITIYVLKANQVKNSPFTKGEVDDLLEIKEEMDFIKNKIPKRTYNYVMKRVTEMLREDPYKHGLKIDPKGGVKIANIAQKFNTVNEEQIKAIFVSEENFDIYEDPQGQIRMKYKGDKEFPILEDFVQIKLGEPNIPEAVLMTSTLEDYSDIVRMGFKANKGGIYRMYEGSAKTPELFRPTLKIAQVVFYKINVEKALRGNCKIYKHKNIPGMYITTGINGAMMRKYIDKIIFAQRVPLIKLTTEYVPVKHVQYKKLRSFPQGRDSNKHRTNFIIAQSYKNKTYLVIESQLNQAAKLMLDDPPIKESQLRYNPENEIKTTIIYNKNAKNKNYNQNVQGMTTRSKSAS